MAKEEQPNYEFALQAFRDLVVAEGSIPSIILTDEEKALKNALIVVFPTTNQILCVWQVNKNILGKVQQTRNDKACKDDEGNKDLVETQKYNDKRKEFMKRWADNIYTKTE